ncbi:hypothetical protein [Actinoplanes sp. DH11]|uniref:hypothetical protein n=1 Tax=Actinoplanes sp. DH11 TaxID=2857011 RepID=UPI001E4952D7|nr:hypothetical protein [Actinoplanes sp. DH11]
MKTRLAVTRADLAADVCQVPEQLAKRLPSSLTVVFDHRADGVTPGRIGFTSTLSQDIGWQLSDIAWPDDLQPGVLISLTWQAAKEELHLRTVALDEPMRVDGVDYFHEYDPRVVTREFDPGRSNHGQVLGVIRTQGRVFEDGSAVFAEADLAARSGLGRGTKGTFLLKNAVEQLLREGYVTRVEGSLDADGNPSYPAVDGEQQAEMMFYAPLVEPVPHPSGERSEHWVNGFVRKLPPGARPSPKQMSLHRQAIESEQIDEPLAPGYTFVKKHHRHG